jgi:hypothetical protein
MKNNRKESLKNKARNPIHRKVHFLLQNGFVPDVMLMYHGTGILKYDLPIECYDYWVLEGRFLSNYCPHEGMEVPFEEHQFEIKANVTDNHIMLSVWGEIWEDYTIIEDLDSKYNRYKSFSKEDAEKDIKTGRYKRKDIQFNTFSNSVLYLMQSGDYIKIGVSKEPYNRQKTIGTKLPLKINPIRHYIIDSSKVYYAESFFHRFFKDKKSNGEWFKLSNLDIQVIDFLFRTMALFHSNNLDYHYLKHEADSYISNFFKKHITLQQTL